ncbi:zinc finger, CCHC-type containing protein [Tanacetum coccineum]|uniref:Zinc finger, CCHC-type containing protein n=1 Tax=Tanacetum coccineum TaxID=301880 RepID=A0ABQ5HZ43_9ASTR
MVVAAVKHMALNFSKLDKFKGVDFRRWQKKMHFLISSMNVVYVLTSPILEDGENATMDQIRRRNKWENDDYVCKGLILNGMPDPLFDIYQNFESSKELWNSFKAKYMAKDASSKKFTQHKINIDSVIQVSYIIDKLPSWKKFKHTLKRNKEELTLVKLGSHLRIEESLRAQDSDKPKRNNVAGPLVVNMVEHNNSFRYNDNKGKRKHHDTKADPNKKSKVTCWKCGKPRHLKNDCKGGKIGNKANGSGTNGSMNGSSNLLKDMPLCLPLNRMIQSYGMPDWAKSTLKGCDLHATPLLRNKKYFVTFINDTLRFCYVYLSHSKDEALDKFKCIFVGYAEHSKAFGFYVIEPNESILINSIIESRDAIFDENRFSSVPRPSQRSLMNGTEDIGALVVPEEVTKELWFNNMNLSLEKAKGIGLQRTLDLNFNYP